MRASVVTFSTDQSGANTQIDEEHSKTFNFSVQIGQTVTGILGDFTIKRGSKTTEPIVFTLYQDIDAKGLKLASVSVAASSVSQSYRSQIFDLDPLTTALVAGNYSLKLSSTTGDSGSRQYFFKNGAFVSSNLSVASSSLVAPPAVPEPATILSLASGLALAALGRRARPRG